MSEKEVTTATHPKQQAVSRSATGPPVTRPRIAPTISSPARASAGERIFTRMDGTAF